MNDDDILTSSKSSSLGLDFSLRESATAFWKAGDCWAVILAFFLSSLLCFSFFIWFGLLLRSGARAGVGAVVVNVCMYVCMYCGAGSCFCKGSCRGWEIGVGSSGVVYVVNGGVRSEGVGDSWGVGEYRGSLGGGGVRAVSVSTSGRFVELVEFIAFDVVSQMRPCIFGAGQRLGGAVRRAEGRQGLPGLHVILSIAGRPEVEV